MKYFTTTFANILLFSIIVVISNGFNTKYYKNNRYNFRIKIVNNDNSNIPLSSYSINKKKLNNMVTVSTSLLLLGLNSNKVIADGGATATTDTTITTTVNKIDYGKFRVPYNHINEELKNYLSDKATIVFILKIDDPQTPTQFPSLLELYNRYKSQGLNMVVFPTDQGWFEPDDDETIRAKCQEYYNFGDYPRCVVFDKVDVLGPSAHPLFTALTQNLLTPNGYGRITLNYEKFLLDGTGTPVRRYPRKYSAYDMESDVQAVLKGETIPEESTQFLKAWREAKREAVKSEYAFRYNYNYYNSPDSMYKYNPQLDSTNIVK